MTHCLNGSVTTGHASAMPNARATIARSASVVCGVILSTMLLGKATLASIHAPNAPSRRFAYDTIIRLAMAPLFCRLSHDWTVNGVIPPARRRSSASQI